ncbi:MAG TPA: YbaB/EbfC family nucleoid-associated protein [Pseudonocardiaceae bacterium]|jgi:DNA-binding protein YbaB|nr:YbaB/EbfC family nucleoid-associated protein [Pseudonocardiaceae bacterium]
MDPQQWLRDYQARGEAMVRRSQEFQEQVQDLSETVTSRDGAVTVTVGASGALQDLAFSARIRQLPEVELARLIVQTAREAQHRVAHRVAALVEPVTGETEALAFLRGQLPPLDDEQRDGPPRCASPRDDDDVHNGPFLR